MGLHPKANVDDPLEVSDAGIFRDEQGHRISSGVFLVAAL